jgi:hypothetical protein
MARVKFVSIPGASLLELEPVEGGLRVRCPGCGCVQVLGEQAEGVVEFIHEDECPVHARIAAEIAKYERAVVNRG